MEIPGEDGGEPFGAGWCIVFKTFSFQVDLAAGGKDTELTEEQDWIHAARRGDAEAWEHLVQAYQQPIFRLAYLLLGDADDADDLTQETFLRAYHALARFDASRPVRPWLMRITTNLCHNWRRGVGRYLAALQRALQEQRALPDDPAAGTHVQQAEQNIQAQLLWQAVRRLRLEDQQVIYLRYFLDCSEVETAEVLGIAQGTVKSRLHRALARLRGVLEKEYPHMVREEPDVF